MTPQAERWLAEFDRHCGDRLRPSYEIWVEAWRLYRDGLPPAEAVALMTRGEEYERWN